MTAKRSLKNALVLLLLPALSGLALLPTTACAKGEPGAGMTKSLPCEACHGKDGRGIDPNYPVLAGQHRSYLVKALSDYRSGKRTNVIMAGMAGPLSNQDIEDLASFYSSMQGLQDLSKE